MRTRPPPPSTRSPVVHDVAEIPPSCPVPQGGVFVLVVGFLACAVMVTTQPLWKKAVSAATPGVFLLLEK